MTKNEMAYWFAPSFLKESAYGFPRVAVNSVRLLLDIYTGAAAAYSLRKLSGTYTGAPVRVRRDSDGVEADIGFDSSNNLDETALMAHVKYENYCTYSETFASHGTYFTYLTLNAAVAPNGSNAATKLTEWSTTNRHSLDKTNSPFNLTTQYTYSVYAKAAERNFIILSWYYSTSTAYACFDLTTGLVTQSGVYGTAQLINTGAVSVGNGWWRVSITGYGIRDCSLHISPTGTYTTTDGTNSYTGVLNSGIYIWGAQLNLTSLKTYQQTAAISYNGFGYVSVWYDQSGNARDQIQKTTASQPRIVNAGVVEKYNSKPSVRFIPASSHKMAASFTSTTMNNLSLFLSGYSTGTPGASGSGTAVYSIGGYYVIFRNFLLDQYGTFDGNNPQAVYTWNLQNLLITHFSKTPNIIQNFTNGVLRGTGTINYAKTASSIILGQPGFGGYYDGYMHESVAYFSDQSSIKTQIEKNISSYYTMYWDGSSIGLLDAYPASAAAYSLRNLSSTYTGPLIRVRRSSDSTEQDIYGTYAGALNETALLAFVGANSGFVSIWYDQSGNGRNATQATAASQPRIVNTGVIEKWNGRPSLRFYNSAQSLASYKFAAPSTNWAFFTIVSMDNVSGNNANVYGIDGNGYNGNGIYLQASSFSSGAGRTGSNVTIGAGVISNTTLFIANGNYFSDNTALYAKDNIESGIQNMQSAFGPFVTGTRSNFILGQYTSTGSVSLIGNISEHIVYQQNLGTNRIGIRTNINSYYTI